MKTYSRLILNNSNEGSWHVIEGHLRILLTIELTLTTPDKLTEFYEMFNSYILQTGSNLINQLVNSLNAINW